MRSLRLNVDAALAMLKRDLVFFVSYRLRFVSQIASGFVSVVLFYYVSRLVSVSTFRAPDDYFAYVVIGLVILHALVATLQYLPQTLRQELVAGTMERLVLSPFGAVGAILSMLLFPFALAVLSGIATLLFANLVFGMSLEWSTVPLGIPVALLGALAFAPFALLLAASVLSVKQVAVGASLMITGLSLIGGVFFPPALLPGWVEWTSSVQPLTPALDLLRHLFVGDPLEAPAWVALVKIGAFAAVLLPLSIAVLSSSLRFAQRRGTVIEY